MERVPLKGSSPFAPLSWRFRFDGGTGEVVLLGEPFSRVRGRVEFQCNEQIVGSLNSVRMTAILRHHFPPRPEPLVHPTLRMGEADKTVFRVLVDTCRAPSSLLHLVDADGPVRSGWYKIKGQKFLVQAYQNPGLTHVLSCGSTPIDFRQVFRRLQKAAERKWPAPVQISDGWLSLVGEPVDFRRGRPHDLAIRDARGQVHVATLTSTKTPPYFHFDLHEVCCV